MDSKHPPQFKLDATQKESQSAGQSSGLNPEVQGQMESSMGADFSNVNIHANSGKATSMGALAYAQGNDVHFAPGQFNQESDSGKELIGHELAHVKQQREGRVQANAQAGGMAINNDQGLEKEADDMGKAAVQAKADPGKSFADAGSGGSGGGSVQMKPKDDPLAVDQGQLTFDVEGNDNSDSRYFSRVCHWPGGVSGVTIGRGFDLGQRGADANKAYLEQAGITGSQASLLVKASKLTGKAAGAWTTANKDKVGEINHDQQKKLFDIVYNNLKKDVERISNKKDVVGKYGATDFSEQHPAITDILVDLRYRGDYHPRSRGWIQAPAAQNDLKKIASIMGNARWISEFGVPKHRFEARKKYMQDALAGKVGTLDTGGKDKDAEKDSSSESTNAIGTGVVTASALNVRSGPGPENGKVGQALRKDASVTVYGESNGWLKIGEGQWVSKKFIKFTPGKKQEGGPGGGGESGGTIDAGTVTASALNVRSGPGGGFGKVGKALKSGAAVKVYEKKDGWLRIGDKQWVSGKFVKLTGKKEEPKADKEQSGTKDDGGGAAKPTSSGTVSASSLNVRVAPDPSAKKSGDPLRRGAKVDIFEERNGWVRIGPNRWVSGRYIQKGGAKPSGGGGGTGPKPSWMRVAEGEMGQKEIKGSKHNSRIVEYHQATSGKFQTDEIPWCASFINWVFKQSGVPNTNSARALSFQNYGQVSKEPHYGAVGVISWGGGKGHVGFVTGVSGDRVQLLGGNQGDSVKISSFPKSKFVSFVYPGGYEIPSGAFNLDGSKDVEAGGGLAETR